MVAQALLSALSPVLLILLHLLAPGSVRPQPSVNRRLNSNPRALADSVAALNLLSRPPRLAVSVALDQLLQLQHSDNRSNQRDLVVLVLLLAVLQPQLRLNSAASVRLSPPLRLPLLLLPLQLSPLQLDLVVSVKPAQEPHLVSV